jgi:hypothetical protein
LCKVAAAGEAERRTVRGGLVKRFSRSLHSVFVLVKAEVIRVCLASQ